MKKKILKISAVSIAVVIVAALLAWGILALIMRRNVAETGNLLGVSWYNETDTEFTITTVEELREFARLSSFYTFEGQTVKLGADLVLNEGNAADWAENAPQNKWRPIKKFAGKFDGQGHTISGLYAKSYETQMAMFVDTSFKCTIQNLKLVNSYFETTGFMGTASFATGGGGKFIGLYSNAIFNHQGENVGGIASSIRKQSTFEECWFDGTINTTLRDCGGIVDEIQEGRADIKHCLFSGEINSTYDFAGTRTGGICGRLDSKGTVVIQDSLSSGKINAAKTVYTGGILGAAYGGTSTTMRDTYLSTDSYNAVVGEYGSNGTLNGTALRLQPQRLIGVSAYQWTTLDFENYWSAVEGGTPVLKRFAEEELSLQGVAKAYDISWYSSSSFSYEIANVEQLYGLYYVSGYDNFSGKTVKLAADIEVNTGNAKDWEKARPEYEWYPIGSFAGTFDGQGHTISGLYSVESQTYQGFIAKATTTSLIKNFSIKNSYFCNTHATLSAVGSVAGETYGDIENIYSNAIVVAHSLQAGGLLGRANDNDSDGKKDVVTISNCWFDGSVTLKGEANAQGAGLVGRYVQGDLDIVHCLNTGSVTAETAEGRVYIGGFIGCGSFGKGTLNITDSMSTGKVTNLGESTDSVGGVIGRFPSTLSKTYFQKVYTTKESNENAIGGYIHPEIYGGVIQLEESWYTGNNAYRFTELDFPNYWALTKNSTPVLQMFASSDPSTKGIQKRVDTSWYKLDGKSFVIKNQAQMLGFSMLGMCYTFKDQTVRLGANIAMDPSLQWISIGTSYKLFAGTFDGQGHTISGLQQKTDEVRGGMFGAVNTTGVLKNFRLVDSSFEFYDEVGNEKEVLVWLGSVCGDFRGYIEQVYSNASVTSNGNRAGGLIGMPNGVKVDGKHLTCTIKNCWFDGSLKLVGPYARYGGGIAGQAMQGNVEILHCLFTGSASNERTTAGQFIGGIIGSDQNAGCNILVKDCLSAGKVTAAKYNQVGALVGGARLASATYTIVNSYATDDSCVYSDGVLHLANKHDGKLIGYGVAISKSELLGTEAYKWTLLDFDSWVARENEIPVPKPFATGLSLNGVAKMVDTSWYSADAKEFTLTTPAQVYGLSVLAANHSFEGQTIKLGSNIDMKDYSSWSSIGSLNMPFKGTLDGQGYTISNLTQETSQLYGGLVGYMLGGTVQNVKLVDSTFESTRTANAFIGSIVGGGQGKLLDSYSNATVISTGVGVGGLVGRSTGMEISGCWYDGAVTVDYKGDMLPMVGGILGTGATKKTTIDNCLYTGDVTLNFTCTNPDRAWRGVLTGGIVGADGAVEMTISDTISAGTVNATWKHNDETGSTNPTQLVDVDDIIGQAKSTKTTYSDNVYSITGGTWSVEDSGRSGSISGNMSAASLIGTEGYRYTDLDFNTYWAVRANEVPGIKKFVSDSLNKAEIVKADTSWYDESKEDLYIDNEAEFYGFTQLVSEGKTFEGKTVHLQADLAMNKMEEGTLDKWEAGTEVPLNPWIPIGNNSKKFLGSFDGGNHTISGIYVKTSSGYAGLFGYAEGATSKISNFKLTNSYIELTGSNFVGSVIGSYWKGTLENIYSDARVVSSGTIIGGIAGRLDGTVSNCWFAGKVTCDDSLTANVYAGGIVGTTGDRATDKSVTISNCLNTGTIISNADSTSALRIGGILGGTHLYSVSTKVSILNCVNGGELNVKGTTAVGTIAGSISKTTKYAIENSYARNDSIASIAAGSVQIIGKIETSAAEKSVSGSKNMTYANLQGARGYVNTKLDFDTIWCAREGEVPGLQKFASASASLEGAWRADTSWYKEEANELHITNEDEFLGFAELVNQGVLFEDKIVYLDADLTLNKVEEGTLNKWEAGTEVPLNAWTPIGNGSKMFMGTFDGQMHTISGVYMKEADVRVGLFGAIGLESVVKNFYLTDSYFYTSGGAVDSSGTLYAYLGSVVGECRGTVDTVYSNAIVATSEMRVGGIVGVLNTTSSNIQPGVNNCWFDGKIKLTGDNGTRAGGIAALGVQRTGYIRSSLFTGEISYEASHDNVYVGGILGGDGWQNTVNIEDSVSAGTITGPDSITVAAVLGGFRSKSTSNMVNVYATTETFASAGKAIGNVPTGATVGTPVFVAEASLQGINGYSNTLLDFEDTWCARTGAVPALKSFTKVNEANKENPVITDFGTAQQNNWYSDSITKYGIHSASAFKAFRDYTNGTIGGSSKDFYQKTVYLKSDIDLNPDWKAPEDSTKAVSGNPEVWTPIANYRKNRSVQFRGTLDGQGHTISGVYVQSSVDQYAGLFGRCSTATISNLVLKNSYIEHTGAYWTGSIVGMIMGGTVSNVYSDAIVVTSASQIGGIAGRAEGTVSGCWFAGELKSTKTTAANLGMGGIVGVSNTAANLTISDCLNSGKLISSVTDANATTALCIGGIYGTTQGATPTLTIKNCVNAGMITAKPSIGIGAIAGVINKANTKYTIQNCSARKDCISSKPTTATIIGSDTAHKSGSTTTGCALVELSALQGAQIYTNTNVTLDYTNWIARKTDVVIPKCFVGIVVSKDNVVEKE